MIRDMLPASVKKMIRRKSLQYSIAQDEPTTEQYIYRRHVVGLDLGLDIIWKTIPFIIFSYAHCDVIF